MKVKSESRVSRHVAAAVALLMLLCVPAVFAAARNSKVQARSQFDIAEKMREALNGQPASERSKREYQRVMDAYRRVYYMSPASSRADASVVAVAELLAEMGRAFNDDKALRSAIGQYEFLRREYPGSKYRFDALFTIGQIYKDDLDESDKAKESFQEFLRRYPRHRLAADAKDAIGEMDAQASAKQKREKDKPAAETREAKAASQEKKSSLPLVTGIRYWSTPDYTRVAIDLESEVKYEAGRVPDPDRIFFDLHDTKLASVLVGKNFDVSDGFLRKIRVAQFQKGLTRVVLDVDDVSDYSAFLLPNPYRLIIDIHGRQPQKMLQAKGGKPDKAEAKQETKQEAKQEQKSAPAPKPEKETTTVASTTTADGVKKIVDNAPVKDKERPTKSAKVAPSAQDDDKPEPSTKTEVAKLNSPSKATNKPTTEPTFESVAPRAPEKKAAKNAGPAIHSAKPTSNGERSLIRALGLKIGKIVVDAGHGGHDTGTIGPSGLLEKDLTLDVALRLGRLLEGRLGAEVVYTRDDDTFIPLETRTAIANQNQADLFISIHANSSNDQAARGIETYYLNFTSSADALEVAARENAVSEKSIHELQDLVKKIALKEKIEESREFAADVQRALYSGVAQRAPGIRDRGVKKAPFIVLIGANMPSILAEVSFLSNPTDERKLQAPEHRQKIAESLYRGISKYVSGLSGVKLATKGKEEMGQ